MPGISVIRLLQMDLHLFPELCIPCSNTHLTHLDHHKSRIVPDMSRSYIRHRYELKCMVAHMNHKLRIFHRISRTSDR